MQSAESKSTVHLRPLRLWPAALLLVVMGATRFAPAFFNEFSREVFMVMVFGPVGACLGIILWWTFFSRATVRERWFGLAGLVVLTIVGYPLCHESMRAMFYMIYVLPTAYVAFVLGVGVTSWLAPGRRLAIGLAVAVIGLSGWTIIRNTGLSGSYETDFRWRFKKTEEEAYLESLAQAKQGDKRAADEPLGVVAWPQFRGVHRDAVVPGVVLAEDWTSHPPQSIWKRKIGPGWSSFALAGSRLFTQEQRGESEVVLCLDADTGTELWVQETPTRFFEAVAGPGPRATPTLADGKLYTLGAMGLLQCLQPATGQPVWQRNLLQDEQRPPIWGFSSSPLAVDGLIIVHVGGSGEHAVKAFAAATGEPRWSRPASENSYSSPQLATVQGKPVILMLTGDGLLAIDPSSGQEAWNYEWKFAGYRALQPLVLSTGDFLVPSSIGAGTRRVSFTPEAEPKFKTQWTSREMQPDFNDFVVHQGFLYGFDKTMFACINLETGKRAWTGGRYGKGQALLLPDRHQILVLAESGELILLRANPEKLEELAKIPAITGKTWNHPILAGTRVYVRNGEEAACLELPLATPAEKR